MVLESTEDIELDRQLDVTQLLAEWRDGDRAALDRLIPLIHSELRALARRFLRDERRGHTLQASALVNEAYLKLASYRGVDWQSRAQFFATAASVIRHILVDHARTKRRGKRGGAAIRIALQDAPEPATGRRDPDLIALDDAMFSLQAADPRQSRIVELRFFGGLSIEETAAVMDLSPATVKRDWIIARTFLYHELKQRGAFLPQ